MKSAIEKALADVDAFRIQECKVLIADILKRIELIKSLSCEEPQFEKQRVVTIKQRLQDKMKEWGEIKNIDENRLEQEIIYYLEKLDITEEKVRLANHCKYFVETVEKEEAPGRKLGFIAQEIGREINTMGSKANDHDIQKLVVRMKDELENSEHQGRKLDFIAQEMNREANTILSKANDLEVTNYAIELKAEIEKIREQIQNIE